MTDTQTLIAELEAGPGSRELDEALYNAVGRPGDDDPQAYAALHGDCPPHYTTSRDAIAALQTEQLPDWRIEVWNEATDVWVCGLDGLIGPVSGRGKTEPLARCIAFLRAKEASNAE